MTQTRQVFADPASEEPFSESLSEFEIAISR